MDTPVKEKKAIRMFKVRQDSPSFVCETMERKLLTKHSLQKCVKVPQGTREELKGNRAANTKNDKVTEDTRSHCIVDMREKLPVRDTHLLLQFSTPVKSGMKLTLCGGFKKGKDTSLVTVSMDPQNPTNPMTWLHVVIHWSKKHFTVREGFSSTKCYSQFKAISDPTHFTLAIELTSSATKLYVSKVFLKAAKHIPYFGDLNVYRFQEIHRLVVQKTDGDCSHADIGIP